MGRRSHDLGLTLEDTVELWLSRRGLAYERRKKVSTPLGFPVEIDFLVHDNNGKVVVEVKNLERPVDRDVIIKAWNNAVAIGAYKAIVVSSSGFTEPAIKVARSLERVELLTLDEIAREIELGSQRALYASPGVSGDDVIAWARERLAERLLFIFKKEEVREAEGVYVPLYLIRSELRLGGERYAELELLASGLTCLPLALRGDAMAETMGELVGVPRDVLELYKRYKGSSVSRPEFIRLHGESGWQRFTRHLLQAGLLRRISERPAIFEVKDVFPRLEDLRAAARTIRITWKGEEGFRPLDYACTPGSTAMMLEALLEARVRSFLTVLAPAYIVKLEDRAGTFRRALVASWTPRPMRFITRFLH